MQALYFGPAEKEEEMHREKVERVIDFLDLQSIRRTPVGSLPYGLQKRVELGRALAMEPEVLLLDEPMAGMNVEENVINGTYRYLLSVGNDKKEADKLKLKHRSGKFAGAFIVAFHDAKQISVKEALDLQNK